MLKTLDFSGRAALFAAIAGFVLAFVTTNGETLIALLDPQEAGRVSLTGLLLLLALGLGVIVTTTAYRRDRPVKVIERQAEAIQVNVRSNFVARLAAALAASVILFAVTALLLYGVHFFFQGVTLNRLTVIVVVTGYAGLVSFGLASWASWLDSINLLVLAGLIGLTGIVVAALAVGDPFWWQRSLSYLGSTETAGIYFNIALILTGLLVLTVNQETLAILRGLVEAALVDEDYARWARIYMLAIPVCIVGVGLFPTRITPLSDLLHNLSSHLMVVFFVILMLFTVSRQDSFHSQSFQRISRWFAWLIIIFIALEKLEAVNFVAFELIILVPIGIWLALYQVQVYQFAVSGKPPEVQRQRAATPLAAYALRTALITATLGGVITIAYVSHTPMVPFAGLQDALTIGELWIILGFILGVGVTALAYRRFATDQPELSPAEREALQMRRSWLARGVVSAAAGIVSLVLTIVLVLGVDLLFPNVALSYVTAILVTAAYAGVLGFALAYWVGDLSSVNLLVLAVITAVLGMGAAALFIGDSEWWRVSLSYLGSQANPTSIFFNLGILLTGLILLIVNQDSIALLRVMRDDHHVSADYFMQVRWLLVLIPLLFAAIGIFPRRISPTYDLLHNLSASAMVFAYLLLAFFVVAGKHTIHQRAFIQRSRLLAVLVLVLYGLYLLEIVNYVGFELLLFVPVGVWLVLYQVELNQFTRQIQPDAAAKSG